MEKFIIPVNFEDIEPIKAVCQEHSSNFRFIGKNENDNYVDIEIECKEASYLYLLGCLTVIKKTH